MRSLLTVYLKGFLMGAADTVPGVSGGTIALITGIYERLIDAITSVDPGDVEVLGRLHTAEGRADLAALFVRADALFLAVLGFGIASAVVTLSRFLHTAVQEYPALMAAFFFGLIAASAVVLYSEVDVRTPRRLAVAVAGVVLAVAVTAIPESQVGNSLPVIFVTGMIAICAMILPGVSGSFFLYVFQQYEYVTGMLKEFVDGVIALADGGDLAALTESFTVVATFCLGALLGLLTMSRVVKWALEHYREATLTFLVSLMVGGLALPLTTIAETEPTSTGDLLPILGLAIVGGALVLGVDFVTDDLAYE
ncbi:DUF368 domain-containing protein [Haloarchaeobius sp. HRN-SO-5]|uniref:DUF368 domain-containing protein n=1 Tax=Haloarchaeobius sp. HRN-SO-5 TaxID=3446118 RepID=UPI003EC1008B